MPVSLPGEELLRIEAAWTDELLSSCMPEGVKTLRAVEPELELSRRADPRLQGASWIDEPEPCWEERKMEPLVVIAPREELAEELESIRRTESLARRNP